jgi:hypothetical protein
VDVGEKEYDIANRLWVENPDGARTCVSGSRAAQIAEAVELRRAVEMSEEDHGDEGITQRCPFEAQRSVTASRLSVSHT